MKFRCKKKECDISCCGKFSGITDKIVPIGQREFNEIILTNNDLQVLLQSKYSDYVYISYDGLGRVKTDSNGKCRAFSNDQCEINEFKPTICKCFPLYLDLFIGLCTIKSCPSTMEGLLENDYKSEIKSFIEMCEFWIGYYKERLLKMEQTGGEK
jgi:Fe-S-cluster containining protein